MTPQALASSSICAMRATVFSVLTVSAMVAVAAPPELIQTRRVETLTSHCCWDNWLNIQVDSGANNDYQVNSWNQSWATVQAQSAQFGLLGGRVSAGSQMPGGYTGSGGTATIRDAWSDLFTINSATLAIGTPVQLQLTVQLNVSLFAKDPDGNLGSGAANGRAAAAFQFAGWDAPWITGVDLHTGTGHAASTIDGLYSSTAFINTAVGQTLHLVGAMSLVYGQRNSPEARDWFSGSSEGSARFLVDVVTPGAAFSTASNFAYAAPVPEPAGWALMTGGLFVLALATRRRLAASGRAPVTTY
jgi:hypothetical protein